VLDHADAQPAAPLALPTQIVLDDERLTLRYLEATDREAILAFAAELPTHDLLFLRRDITRPDQVDEWLREAATGQVVTILAIRGTEIVGYATVASEGLAWTRHVRELRVMVAAPLRGKKLGHVLTAGAFAVAREQGAKKMLAQMTVDQGGAIAVFKSLGFDQEARLRGQVIDREGKLHDLLIMSLNVDEFESKLQVALWSSLVVDTPR
jgi:L-amino acid N-acyltransferase YncA